MNHIAQAIAATFATAQALGGEVVTYNTCTGDSFEVTAVPMRTDFEQQYGAGVIQFQSQDWLILATDLMEGSILPRRGDYIKDSGGRFWRLLSDEGEPQYRFNDQYRVVVRAHSRLSEKEC